MDRVTVENTSAEYVQIDLAGPRAGEKLSLLGLPAVPQPGEVLPGKVDGTSLHVIGHLPGGGPGYRLILPTGALQPVQHVLEASGVFRQTHEEYETWRVEAGLPGKNELSEEYTPLEVGLQAAISDRKGCYTGQEVIARQLTYDKVTRHLVGLRLEAPAPVGSLALAEGKPAGVITSSVRSPAFGPIALAVLRRPYNQSGTQVVVRPEGNEIKGMVTTLPFEPHNL
jgi:folate-binding protein YgfZ